MEKAEITLLQNIEELYSDIRSLLKELAARLSVDFGKGFDESNLRYMRLFYRCFPKWDTLRHELTWSHYRRLISVEDEFKRMLETM